MMAWRMTADDIPWALALAQKAYARPLDGPTWGRWIAARLDHPDWLLLRSDFAILVGAVQPMLPDFAETEGLFPYWMREPGAPGYAADLVGLFRAALGWMEDRGASCAWLKPTTGVDAAPLASILGFGRGFPCFVKEIRACQTAATSSKG